MKCLGRCTSNYLANLRRRSTLPKNLSTTTSTTTAATALNNGSSQLEEIGLSLQDLLDPTLSGVQGFRHKGAPSILNLRMRTSHGDQDDNDNGGDDDTRTDNHLEGLNSEILEQPNGSEFSERQKDVHGHSSKHAPHPHQQQQQQQRQQQHPYQRHYGNMTDNHPDEMEDLIFEQPSSSGPSGRQNDIRGQFTYPHRYRSGMTGNFMDALDDEILDKPSGFGSSGRQRDVQGQSSRHHPPPPPPQQQQHYPSARPQGPREPQPPHHPSVRPHGLKELQPSLPPLLSSPSQAIVMRAIPETFQEAMEYSGDQKRRWSWISTSSEGRSDTIEGREETRWMNEDFKRKELELRHTKELVRLEKVRIKRIKLEIEQSRELNRSDDGWRRRHRMEMHNTRGTIYEDRL
jgi:hypothetical protein